MKNSESTKRSESARELFCIACGSEHTEKDAFCPTCGEKTVNKGQTHFIKKVLLCVISILLPPIGWALGLWYLLKKTEKGFGAILFSVAIISMALIILSNSTGNNEKADNSVRGRSTATATAIIVLTQATAEATLAPDTKHTPIPKYTPIITNTLPDNQQQVVTKPGPSLTSTPVTSSKSLELSVTVGLIADDLPKYERNTWKHWTDEDKDCQNARHEVLINESHMPVVFKTSSSCQVLTGTWLDPYTDIVINEASKLDVDHMVPLKNAHESGAWAWNELRKTEYANDMSYPNHLVAVSAGANRQKGAKGPEDWKPSNEKHWCHYAIDWISIKSRWGLIVTEEEFMALKNMLETCHGLDIKLQVETSSPVLESPTAILPKSSMASSESIRLKSIDCTSKPEILIVVNEGDAVGDLDGWQITDEGPKHTFSFPKGFQLRGTTSLKLISGVSGRSTDTSIYWSTRPVWNNSGDTASLYDSSGKLIQKLSCR